MALPSFQEKLISQLPAVALLQKLGYEYLSPEKAVEARGGRLGSVLLDKILTEQLRRQNTILFRGRTYPFSEGNILVAVQALKDIVDDGLLPTNEKAYDLLCMGKSLQQSVEGDTKSFQLNYIDWEHPRKQRLPRDRGNSWSSAAAARRPADPTSCFSSTGFRWWSLSASGQT